MWSIAYFLPLRLRNRSRIHPTPTIPPFTLIVCPVMYPFRASMTATLRRLHGAEPAHGNQVRSGVGVAHDHFGLHQAGAMTAFTVIPFGENVGIGMRQAEDACLGCRVVRADHAAKLGRDGG